MLHIESLLTLLHTTGYYMTWYLWALLASFIWGLHYCLISYVLKDGISPITIFAIPIFLMLASLPFYYRTLIDDIAHIVYSTDTFLKSAFITIAFTSIIASLSLYKAIHSSTPTTASILEITYPLFVTLFAYLLLDEQKPTTSTIIGGLLIMIGAIVVISGKSN